MPSALSTKHHRQARRSHLAEDPTYRGALQSLSPSEYREPAAPSTFVYFLLDPEDAQIKIGWTKDVARRVRHLSSQRRRTLELIGSMAGSYDLERALHARFEQYRIPGTREWYSSEIVVDLLWLLTHP